ncbi:MAG TPA: DedA family protein [Gemmatimonadales bacterium]|nr:DedA family protein [Gemmatimonadales bacterium]
MSHLEPYLSRYGLIALYLVATVEGDLSMIVAGILAHLGVLSLPGAMVAGALGNLTGDLAWFWVGHWYSAKIRASRLYAKVGPRIERLAGRLGPWQLLAARVVYGTRNASMLFWGQMRLAPLRFILVNGLGCALAALGFTSIGYAVGESSEVLVGTVRRVEHLLLAGVVIGALIVWGVNRLVRRKLAFERTPSDSDDVA